MSRGSKLLTVGLLCFCLGLVEAKAEEDLNWRDCLEEARQNHPELVAAKEELNQAQADRAIARSAAWPQITSSLSGKTSQAATNATTDTYAHDVSLQQLLFDGFETAYQVASAAEDVKSAQYNYQATSAEVRLSLRTAFVELLKAQELLQITQDIAERRKQNVELVQLRYEAGREHKGSLLNTQASFAQAEFEVVQAGRNIDLAQRQLSKELGRRKVTPIRAKGDFQTQGAVEERPDFEHLAETTPGWGELITKSEAARFDLKFAQADFLPEVYANASTGRSDSHWPPHNDVWSANVTLSLPIFEGGSRLAQVSKARAALNQAQAEQRSGRDSLMVTLEQAWKQWRDAVGQAEVKKKFLQAAEERAKITQAQYSTGLISFDDWSIIEDNLVEARKTFLNAQTEALVAQASWIQSKGGTLDDAQE